MKFSRKVFLSFILCLMMVFSLTIVAFAEPTSEPLTDTSTEVAPQPPEGLDIANFKNANIKDFLGWYENSIYANPKYGYCILTYSDSKYIKELKFVGFDEPEEVVYYDSLKDVNKYISDKSNYTFTDGESKFWQWQVDTSNPADREWVNYEGLCIFATDGKGYYNLGSYSSYYDIKSYSEWDLSPKKENFKISNQKVTLTEFKNTAFYTADWDYQGNSISVYVKDANGDICITSPNCNTANNKIEILFENNGTYTLCVENASLTDYVEGGIYTEEIVVDCIMSFDDIFANPDPTAPVITFGEVKYIDGNYELMIYTDEPCIISCEANVSTDFVTEFKYITPSAVLPLSVTAMDKNNNMTEVTYEIKPSDKDPYFNPDETQSNLEWSDENRDTYWDNYIYAEGSPSDNIHSSGNVNKEDDDLPQTGGKPLVFFIILGFVLTIGGFVIVKYTMKKKKLVVETDVTDSDIE